MVVNSAKTAENTGKATNLKRKRPEEEVYVKQEPQEDDVPAGNETEDESEGKEERDDRTTDNNGLLTVKIDPAVLNCPACHKPSQSSLFQCLFGHVSCSRSCAKLKYNKCIVCSDGTGFIRCLAFESLVKSIKVLCRNSNFGCNDVVSYVERDNHEKACIHNPCYCPMPDCTFKGTSSKLSTHFASKHRSSLCYIRYGRFMTVHIERDQPFRVLNARDGHLFLILNSRDVPSGNSLSFACIRQRSQVWDLEYELKIMGGKSGKGNTLYLKGPPMDMTRWDGEYPAKFFLFVPGEHLESQTAMKIDVKIRKIKPVEVE